jgi:hypothetical protein
VAKEVIVLPELAKSFSLPATLDQVQPPYFSGKENASLGLVDWEHCVTRSGCPTIAIAVEWYEQSLTEPHLIPNEHIAPGVTVEVKHLSTPLAANDTWAARVQFDPGNPGDVICVRQDPPPPASRLEHIRTIVSLWEKDTTGTVSFFSDQAIYFTIGNDQVILGSTDEAHGVFWFEYKV